ncbi:hypothetical protein BN938_2363 [Mucinivorans hirudinis]|uniref:Uncharacterized protein n=1 Tax=Mucinivorans hirudinis TaxID=1433126 RepID=A0A060RE70_9BACT|nr:hypothetical protein BN938_2363 [Mucinivorans hirudinis]
MQNYQKNPVFVPILRSYYRFGIIIIFKVLPLAKKLLTLQTPKCMGMGHK